MSWDADLIATDLDGYTYEIRDWNYTHNTNAMASRALEVLGKESPHSWFDGDGPGKSWWRLLDGQSAKESLDFLGSIIGVMSEAPSLFREMNPENGWGDYDQFLGILSEMRTVATEYPSARWQVSG